MKIVNMKGGKICKIILSIDIVFFVGCISTCIQHSVVNIETLSHCTVIMG